MVSKAPDDLTLLLSPGSSPILPPPSAHLSPYFRDFNCSTSPGLLRFHRYFPHCFHTTLAGWLLLIFQASADKSRRGFPQASVTKVFLSQHLPSSTMELEPVRTGGGFGGDFKYPSGWWLFSGKEFNSPTTGYVRAECSIPNLESGPRG